MRFINAIVWLIIIIVPFIGFLILISLPNLNIELIGQGDSISNISYYILSQNPNNPMYNNEELRFRFANQFLNHGVYKVLIFLFIFWLLISLLWMIISELLKIDRPGKAVKYMWLWILFFIISCLLPSAISYYLLYEQNIIWHFAELSRIMSLILFILIYSGLYFYLSSIYITSRVLRPAVPFLNLILRN
tara:strand:- start:712 stop:1281 length:570 start_codon:yes stop_codon:yes gene_type:complete